MTGRLFIAALAVLGIHAAALMFVGRGMPTELSKPQLALDQMPSRLGSWIGKDIPLDSQVFQAIGAEMAISRQYQNRNGSVDLHSDLFLRYGVRVLHPPELCYSSNGFTVENGETIQIASADKASHDARLLTLSRHNVRCYCIYWYQVGDTTFWNGDDQRRVVQSFRGKNVWPPMIKVMLQATSNSPDDAQSALSALAAQVYSWTRLYH